MSLLRRRPTLAPDAHTHWCAQGHRCGLGEHRSAPLVIAITGKGRVILTRVRATNGHEHVEVRLTVALAETETVARKQFLALASDLHTLIRREQTP
jgi:hypothetical protein